MSSETVPVAVEQRDPDDRCRLEDEADGAARVTLLDTAHHVARHAAARREVFNAQPPFDPPGANEPAQQAHSLAGVARIAAWDLFCRDRKSTRLNSSH